MKCPICDTENPPEASSCRQCGFSLSLGRSVKADFPTVEVPEPDVLPQWPEPPGTEFPPPLSVPVWSDSDASATDVESIEEEERAEVEISQVDAFSPALPSDDDELARLHIARGFEAIREGLPDQARWEFEQARDLADDMDIVRAAQAQLDEMSGKTAKVARRQARPIEKRPPQIIPSQLESTDWNPTVRIGLAVGVLNGVLIGCGAVFCLGFFLAPLLGFAAGWLTARRASTVRGEGQSPGAIHAIVAGGITGLGGWLGEVIGHPIWLASLNGSRSDPVAIMLFVACVPGVLYILLAVAASALGWNKGKAE